MYANFFFPWSILLGLLSLPLSGATDPGPASDPEEILLELQVEKLLVFDLDGYLTGDLLYLPLTDLLSHLMIPYRLSDNRNRLEADFPAEDRAVRFDFSRGTIETSKSTVQFSENDWLPDVDNDIYFNREIIEEIFEVELIFDYQQLLVMLFSDHDLPVIEDFNRKKRYDSFRREKINPIPEVTYNTERRFLNGGTMDWSVNSSHSRYQQNYSYGIGAGGQLLGGVGRLSVRGSDRALINTENIRGQWRLPIYNTSLVRQITAGDQSHNNLYSRGSFQYRGVEITNRPNAPRLYFDQFHTENQLQPGWDVELYTNNRMVDFARSQNADSFDFTEPLGYGTNQYTLRYYSPDGFSHEETHYHLIPSSILPPGETEYSLSAGRYRNRSQDFIRAHLRLGLSSSMTLGGGAQLAHDPVAGLDQVPFAETSLKLGGRVLVDGSHSFGYNSQASLRYIFPGSGSITAKMQKFYGTSRFNLSRKTFEGSVNTSFPVKLSGYRFSTFLSARNTRFKRYDDLNLYGGLTAPLPFGYRLQVRSAAILRSFHGDRTERVRSDVMITASKRILRSLMLRPAVDYNHNLGRITGYGLDVSSRIFRNGNFNLSAHYDQFTAQARFLVSFRYELPYARHQSQALTASTGNPSYSQTTSGTVAWSRAAGGFETDNRSWSGRATLKIDPYLVGGEPREQEYLAGAAEQMEVIVYDEMMQPRKYKGGLIKNLTPYRKYLVKVHSEGFDNPLWKLQSETYSVTVLPNTVNTLPVPVTAVGEMSGRITTADESLILQGLFVTLNKTDNSYSKTLQTWSGGQFYYIGLEPGDYTASLDTEQLQKRSLNAEHQSLEFRIDPTVYGDIVDGLNFEVSRQDDVTRHEVFYVQVGAFLNRHNAVALADYIASQTSADAEVLFEPDQRLYKCRAGIFHSESEAREFLETMKRDPRFEDAFLIRIE